MDTYFVALILAVFGAAVAAVRGEWGAVFVAAAVVVLTAPRLF